MDEMKDVFAAAFDRGGERAVKCPTPARRRDAHTRTHAHTNAHTHAHTRQRPHTYRGSDPLLVSGVGMDWPMMEWNSFEDMKDVVVPKLSGKYRNVHPWPDALSHEVGNGVCIMYHGHHRH